MGNIVIGWRELLLVAALILAVYVAEMLLLLRRRGKDGGEANAAEAELRAELARIGARMDALETQLAQWQVQNLPESSPYNRAIQMARQGRDAARISESCGISHGEAELIVSMHGKHE